MCMINDANFCAASLLIISEILKKRNDLKSELFSGIAMGVKKQFKLDVAASDNDSEEVFVDVDKQLAVEDVKP